jgi:hypothetical protein
MKKKLTLFIILIVVAALLFVGYYYNENNQSEEESLDQQVYAQTLSISNEYASLRYQTDNILLGLKDFSDYDAWNSEMTNIIKDWNDLEKNALSLEQLAQKMAEEKVSMKIIPEAYAYDFQEVNNVIESAPNGKKIRTLAKHLGIDAKKAQLILNQVQDYSTREAFGEFGDLASNCENGATVIKNTSKVAVFVGTIAVSAPVGILAKTAVVVSGADLTLEITDDTAKMALGNQNKISAIAGDVRKITEPAAAILSIATLPSSISKGIDKLGVVVFGADQLNSTIQSGSVIGIKLPTYTKENPGTSYEVSVLNNDEVGKWIKEQVPESTPETIAEVEKILEKAKATEEKPIEEEKNGTFENEIKLMSEKEFQEIFDKKVAFKNTSNARKVFGEPDTINTFENGYGNYVYHGRILYPTGLIGSFTIRFNNTEVEGYSLSID